MRSSLSRLVVVRDRTGSVDRDDEDLAAWAAARGWRVDRVSERNLVRNRVALDDRTLVVGSVPSVRAALRQLGASLPEPDDYPEALGPHLHRRIWSSTVRTLRNRLEDGGDPVFAKPKALKRFTGRVFEHPDDARWLAGLSANLEIWCAEVVSWRSEWRVFVVDHEVIGQRHYADEPETAPDAAVIGDCVTRTAGIPDAPDGYAFDVGVLTDGVTALVERNDGFSIGGYGLETSRYADVLIARWSQLLRLTAAGGGP